MAVTEYPKAMHGPDDAYRAATTAEEEKALRAAGWVDGHEHWSKKRDEAAAAERPKPQEAAKDNKGGKPAAKGGTNKDKSKGAAGETGDDT